MGLFKVYDEKGSKVFTFASASNGNVYVLEGNKTNYVYEAGATYGSIVVLKG